MTANAVNKVLEIVESEYRPNQSGTGMLLACKAQEVGGPNEGQLGYLLFDLENDDERVQERGQRAFASLRRAINVLAPDDSSELHYKPFRAMVECNGERLVIRKYLWDSETLAA